MRFTTLLLILPVFSGILWASASPQDPCLSERSGEPFFRQGLVDSRELATKPPSQSRHSHLTNAERFRRGLGPASPTRRSTARRATTSPVPVLTRTIRGLIKITDDYGTSRGYVSQRALGLGGFVYASGGKEASALVVNFQVPVEPYMAVNKLTMSTENGNINNPVLAAVQGRDNADSDIGIGSFHYMYLSSAAASTSPNASPTIAPNSYTAIPRTHETSIWNYNAVTKVLVPRWINTDGSSPETQIWSQGTGIYMGGDAMAFHKKFPTNIVRLSLSFEEIPERSAPV